MELLDRAELPSKRCKSSRSRRPASANVVCETAVMRSAITDEISKSKPSEMTSVQPGRGDDSELAAAVSR